MYQHICSISVPKYQFIGSISLTLNNTSLNQILLNLSRCFRNHAEHMSMLHSLCFFVSNILSICPHCSQPPSPPPTWYGGHVFHVWFGTGLMQSAWLGSDTSEIWGSALGPNVSSSHFGASVCTSLTTHHLSAPVVRFSSISHRKQSLLLSV